MVNRTYKLPMLMLLLNLLVLIPQTSAQLTYSTNDYYGETAGIATSVHARQTQTPVWIVGSATKLYIFGAIVEENNLLTSRDLNLSLRGFHYDPESSLLFTVSAEKLHQFTISPNGKVLTESAIKDLAGNQISSLIKQGGTNFLFGITNDGNVRKIDHTASPSIQVSVNTIQAATVLTRERWSNDASVLYIVGYRPELASINPTTNAVITQWTIASGLNCLNALTTPTLNQLITNPTDGIIRKVELDPNGSVTVLGSLTVFSGFASDNMEKLHINLTGLFMTSRILAYRIVQMSSMTVLLSFNHPYASELAIPFMDPTEHIFGAGYPNRFHYFAFP